jgi:signal transduction histidine kinase
MEASSRAEWALRERVKELTCLYGIAQVADQPSQSLEEVLPKIAELLPPAWQYPEVTAARIVLDGEVFPSAGFREGPFQQQADVQVFGERRGSVDVFYLEARPDWDEGPFLKEERSLVQEVARQVGLLVQRKEAEREKIRFEEQLRRADRLATVGQLAAGVAHELNEPLSAILGYAEIVRDGFGLPDQCSAEVERIILASLRARDIVRNLLVFAREQPIQKRPVKLDAVARDALTMLGARFMQARVRPVLRVAKDLPAISGDEGQLQQVIINLCVNSLQAMPRGGSLRVTLLERESEVLLSVEDNGEGMSDEVQRHVFTPFFTTKAVGQGTGLGLSVVHGIVTAHGGSVQVESAPGRGTTITAAFPAESTGP